MNRCTYEWTHRKGSVIQIRKKIKQHTQNLRSHVGRSCSDQLPAVVQTDLVSPVSLYPGEHVYSIELPVEKLWETIQIVGVKSIIFSARQYLVMELKTGGDVKQTQI